jgi:hypothetical protein
MRIAIVANDLGLGGAERQAALWARECAELGHEVVIVIGPGRLREPNRDGGEFARRRTSNVRPQRQAGFSTVEVKVSRGHLTPEQLRGLADITRPYSAGRSRLPADIRDLAPDRGPVRPSRWR